MKSIKISTITGKGGAIMYLDTKQGLIYEPRKSEAVPIFNWLHRYQEALDGSDAYNQMIEIYESLEFDLSEKKRPVLAHESA
jgi:hypothetical protein